MSLIFYLMANLGHAAKWPALFAAAILALLLMLLTVAMAVALFASDGDRAKRAYKIFVQILHLFRRSRSR